MIGFLGKVLSNMLAMFVAVALLIGGCLYVGGAAVKSAAEASKRHQENIAANPPEAGDATAVVSSSPAKELFEASKNSFAKGVADDLIDQYNIVIKGDDEMAKAARAGAVAEMYLQAKDQPAYEKWKAKSDAHMKRAIGQ
jgi:hypothetical protein